MEEQNELNELKRLMEEQQKKLTETMSAMELKASVLQEKLDRRAKLSSANAEAGVKKVALEYKVVELKIEHDLPPEFNYNPFKSSQPVHQFGGRDKKPINFGGPDILSKEYEDQAVIKETIEKARQKYREFEETKLKELGEDGWTLRSTVTAILSPIPALRDGYTNLYYFSRPL